MKPLGPIGRCSARLRKLLEIKEERDGGITVRVRDVALDQNRPDKGGGSRWMRRANFAVPGPFFSRPVAADGGVSFHFSVVTVSKSHDGGSVVASPGQKPMATHKTAADNIDYITREGAVETIAPSDYAAYADRSGAVETALGEIRAHFTNIHDDPGVRRQYWTKVHDCERNPGRDRLVFHPDRLSRAAWKCVAEKLDLPAEVREIAADIVRTSAPEGRSTPRYMDLPAKQAEMVVKAIRASIEPGPRSKPPLRVSRARGGRTQFRFVAQLPADIDAAARTRIVTGFCEKIAEQGLMYEAVIHAPDPHNDRRNFHLHLSAHDRPAKLIGDKWDFEIAVPVPGQSGRFNYPYRQAKVADFTRSVDGADHRRYGAGKIFGLRESFAELCNVELSAIRSNVRYDPRRLEQMGIDRKATRPLGTRAAPLEAAGVPTSTGIANAEIIWSHEFREAARHCMAHADERRLLNKRLTAALQEAVEAGDDVAAAAIHNDVTILADRARILDMHHSELAAYDVTLAMALARPVKTRETCEAILKSIDDGAANRSDKKAAAAIRLRSDEAAAFLAHIDRVVSRDAELVAQTRSAVISAEQDVRVIGNRLEAKAYRSLADNMDARTAPPLPQRGPAPNAPVLPDREIIDRLFDRVLAEDLPIDLPDANNSNYRVTGISREEYRAVMNPALTAMAQNRLKEIADIQARRMRNAAERVAAEGMEGLETRAQSDSDAYRAFVHAKIYWEHPVFQARLLEQRRLTETVLSIPECSLGERNDSLIGRFKAGVADLFSRRAPASATIHEETNEQLVPTWTPSRAAEPPVQSKDSRQEAIDGLVEALLNDHRLHVLNVGGIFKIAPSEEGWERSIEAFSDEPLVQEAIEKRHISPWLDIPQSERAAIISEIGETLRSPRHRTISRKGADWVLYGTPNWVSAQIHQWKGYHELETLLQRVDRMWTEQEKRLSNSPTMVPTTPATIGAEKQAHRSSSLKRSSVEVAQDPDVLARAWSERRTGWAR